MIKNIVAISLLVATSLFLLNPRIAREGGRPIYAVSCTTGWSLHWLGLFPDQTGSLTGLYSPEGLGAANSALLGNDTGMTHIDFTAIARESITKPCS